MAFTEKLLGQGRYNNTINNTVYTVPLSTKAIIKKIHIFNTTAIATTCRLFLVPSGGTDDESTALFFDRSIAANRELDDGGFYVLEAEGTIQFQNGVANALTITICGAEVT